MEPLTHRLSPDDSIDGVFACYRDGGPRPLLVFNGDHLTGILYPEYVLASTTTEQRPPIDTTPLNRQTAEP
ncbi:hypothetical protein [Nesterenkonia halotolerans]|uniref:Uncharacterized protein n=1 Tax=Nesterenkonia halotolerans TaxID=225325 RepID=A0ABR9J5Z3_9MICC|nr:hypothetical protein [Nesterenkonia halotolerans]MBE1514413.1 hypothetical protein [Nesterenkonia halotolerans]